ncbi:hypothetical protein ACFYR1_45580 [Streptomyces canus]|uniref:hypothetical protein n=1 Tax=Streptomyces canus TaxID=58343 RepID=UPI003690529B
MRLRRIAMVGVVLGLMGVVVRAEGRAAGRVFLGMSDARVSEAAGVIPASHSGTGVRI